MGHGFFSLRLWDFLEHGLNGLDTDWMDEERMLISAEKSYKTKALSWDALKALQGRDPLTQGAALGLTDESRPPPSPVRASSPNPGWQPWEVQPWEIQP